MDIKTQLETLEKQNIEAAVQIAQRDEQINALKEADPKLYWIACGKDDFLIESVVTMRKRLDEHNFPYTYYESPGGHTWTNWRIYLSMFAPMLFKSFDK